MKLIKSISGRFESKKRCPCSSGSVIKAPESGVYGVEVNLELPTDCCLRPVIPGFDPGSSHRSGAAYALRSYDVRGLWRQARLIFSNIRTGSRVKARDDRERACRVQNRCHCPCQSLNHTLCTPLAFELGSYPGIGKDGDPGSKAGMTEKKDMHTWIPGSDPGQALKQVQDDGVDSGTCICHPGLRDGISFRDEQVRRSRLGGRDDKKKVQAYLEFKAISTFFLLLLLSPFSLLAEHTVYIPPVFVRGNFFNQWLESYERAGATASWRHEQALDSAALGRFFGPDGKADFTIGPRYISDLYSSHLIHGNAANERQSVSLHPSSVVQKIDLTLWGNVTPRRWVATKRLALFASLDAAAVEQQLNAMWDSIENKRLGLEHDYQDFFEGRYSSAPGAPAIRQTNLINQKFNNQVMRDTGLSSLSLGAVFQHELADTWFWRMQGLCSIPCTEKNSAEFLFKPRRGMERHYGIGAGVDLKVPLWRWLHATIGLHDMFWLATKEQRTVGIKSRPFSYYLALGKHMQQHEPVTPAANILTQECLVQPGHTMMMNFELRGEFVWGHHVFATWHGTYKEAEKISLTDIWPNAMYAVVNGGYNTSQRLEVAAAPPRYLKFDIIEPAIVIGDAVFLQHKDLNFSVGATPSFFEHHVELGWEGWHMFGGGAVTGGPRVVLGCRVMQGENAHFLPNIFTCEIGLGLKF